MPKQLNGNVKWILGVLAFATVCIGWGAAWRGLSKDVEANAVLITTKVNSDVYEANMEYIKDKLQTLIDGQATLTDKIDKKHD